MAHFGPLSPLSQWGDPACLSQVCAPLRPLLRPTHLCPSRGTVTSLLCVHFRGMTPISLLEGAGERSQGVIGWVDSSFRLGLSQSP